MRFRTTLFVFVLGCMAARGHAAPTPQPTSFSTSFTYAFQDLWSLAGISVSAGPLTFLNLSASLNGSPVESGSDSGSLGSRNIMLTFSQPLLIATGEELSLALSGLGGSPNSFEVRLLPTASNVVSEPGTASAALVALALLLVQLSKRGRA